MNQRLILFYQFFKIKDPETFRLWQLELCQRLELKGRVIVSSIGLNGTLGGALSNLKLYRRALQSVPELRSMQYKWSAGSAKDFPKLSVKTRPEPVTLAAKRDFNPFDSSQGLTPQEWHQYLDKNPETLVLDARNNYESQIGRFKVKNLVTPDIKTFKDIKPIVHKLPKNQTILTYCTGDIRCEYLSAYMKSLGFKKVHHLKGGIIKYGQAFADQGFWQGKCYVFDKRMKIAFSDKSQDLADCLSCNKKTSEQVNCDDCNRQLVVCKKCRKQSYRHCQQAVVSRSD